MSKKFHISVKASSNTDATIKIKGYISQWRNSADDFEAQVDALVAAGIKNAKIYVNSPGGSVFEANEIVNIINKFEGVLTGEIGALCASAATVIIINCHKVVMAKNGQMMIHRPMVAVEGNEDELESALKLLRTLQENYLDMYAAKSKSTREEIAELWRTDYWMDAEEAKKKGFVDEVLGKTENPDPEDIKALFEDKNYKNIPQSLVALATEPPKQKTETENEEYMKVIALMLGLVAEATESEIQSAINDLKARAASADGYKNEIESLKAAENTKKIEALLEKVPDDQKETYRKLATADFASTEQLVAQMKPASGKTTVPQAITDHIQAIQTNGTKKFEEYTPAELEAMADKEPEKYQALIDKHYQI